MQPWWLARSEFILVKQVSSFLSCKLIDTPGYIRSFFGVGNTDKLNQNKRRALYKEGVEIKDVPMATGDAADIKILLEISEVL